MQAQKIQPSSWSAPKPAAPVSTVEAMAIRLALDGRTEDAPKVEKKPAPKKVKQFVPIQKREPGYYRNDMPQDYIAHRDNCCRELGINYEDAFQRVNTSRCRDLGRVRDRLRLWVKMLSTPTPDGDRMSIKSIGRVTQTCHSTILTGFRRYNIDRLNPTMPPPIEYGVLSAIVGRRQKQVKAEWMEDGKKIVQHVCVDSGIKYETLVARIKCDRRSPIYDVRMRAAKKLASLGYSAAECGKLLGMSSRWAWHHVKYGERRKELLAAFNEAVGLTAQRSA